ncbi:MAG TPA: hypothetical protein VF811_02230 [Parasulfuritortus sp.]
MNQQIDLFISTLQTFWSEIAAFFPKMMAALLLFLVGWLLARLAKSAVERLLRLAHFDSMAEKSGLEALAESGGVRLSLSTLISEVIYWLLLLVVAVSITNSLGLQAVSELLNRAVLYLPNVLVSILVLVFGTLLARLVNRLTFAWLNGIKAPGALTISTGAEYAVQIFAFFLALEQLNIGTQLVTAAFSIAFGGIVFALALAFGLGGRDWAAERIKAWSNMKK